MPKQHSHHVVQGSFVTTCSFCEADECSRKIKRCIQHIANEFWIRWRNKFVCSLRSRHKWNDKHRNFQNGDVVLLKTDSDGNQCPMAKVLGTNTGSEGFVRTVTLFLGKTQNDGERILKHVVHKIFL